jgi:acyl-CoA thioesterase
LSQLNSPSSSLNLKSTGEGRFSLFLDASLCTGARDDRHMFGGVGTAAAIMAMEALSGQSALWISTQFHAVAKAGQTLEVVQKSVLKGRSTAQLTLHAQVEGNTVMEAFGATGIPSPRADDRYWSSLGAVPAPNASQPVTAHRNADEDVHGRFEARQARGRFGKFSHDPCSTDGKVLVWFRPFTGVIDRPTLAIIADFLPACTSNALGIRSGGRSMDNLMRFIRLVPTEWVLAEYHIVGVANGVGHGTVTLYAEDGTLLAFGSQSFRLTITPRASEIAAR